MVMMRATEDELRAQRYVSVREFKQRRDDGWFAKLHNMTRRERIDRFGSEIPPIYGPLERWETPDEYERKFAAWLRDQHNVRIEVVQREDAKDERSYRRQFAWGKLFRRDQPRRTKRLREITPSHEDTAKKRWKRDEHTYSRPVEPRRAEGNTLATAVKPEPRAHTSVGVQLKFNDDWDFQAGVDAVSRPSTTQSTREDDQRTTEPTAVHLANGDRRFIDGITRLAVSRCVAVEQDQDLRGSSAECSDDPIEARLWALYGAENELVVRSESALKTSTARLFRGFVEVDEIQQLQDESVRLREALRSSITQRSAAVAMLVTYVWRGEVNDLKALLIQVASRDSPIIQQATHRKCTDWATTLKSKQGEVSALTQELNAAMCSPNTSSTDPEWMERIANLNDALVAVEEDVHMLRSKRRQELKVLLHFDKRLRLDVEDLLKRALM